ncbi:MAG: shikimate kinase [Acidimicrobiia bacterium]
MATRLWLIGMMGSGKTSVGEEVARRLGVDFIDTDVLITSLGGRSIPDIWAEDGEEEFRSLESQMVQSAAEHGDAVIATGGGVVLSGDNIDIMRSSGPVVWLSASPQTMAKRVGRVGGRPLLPDEDDPEAALSRILVEREAAYRSAADHIVTTDGRPIAEIAQEVVDVCLDS